MGPSPKHIESYKAELKEAIRECKPEPHSSAIIYKGEEVATLGDDCVIPLPNPEGCDAPLLSTLRVQDGRVGFRFEKGVGGMITVAIIAQDVRALAELQLHEACGKPPALDLVASGVNTRAAGGDSYYKLRIQVTGSKEALYKVDAGHFTQHGRNALEGTIGPGTKTRSINGQVSIVEAPVTTPDRGYRSGSGCDINSNSPAGDPTALIALLGSLLLRKVGLK